MWAVSASRSYLTPVVTKKIGMKIPKPAASSLRAEVGVGHRAVAVDERDDRAGDEGAEDDLEAQLGGQRHEPDEQDEGGADADLRGRVLQALQDLAQAPGVLDAGDRQRDEHGDHEQPAEQDDLRRGGARLAREEEREQDHGGEVGDRARGDDELPEGRADLVGVLEHGHEHAQRGGRQHDGHEQRLGGQAARLQRQPTPIASTSETAKPSSASRRTRPRRRMKSISRPARNSR